MNKLKVALIGHGHLGKWHAQKIQVIDDVDFFAIVEPNLEQWQEIKGIYPHVQVVKDLEEIIEQAEAFIIATPTSYHAPLVCKLLKKKKHIFCEKPLCQNSEELEDIESLLGDSILQVGHSERYHQIWPQVLEDLTQMGKVEIIQAKRIAPFKGRATDVDVVQDLGIHDLDLLYFLLGDEMSSLEVWGQKTISPHWDGVEVQALTKKGAKFFLSLGRQNAIEERSWRILCEKGELYIDLHQRRYIKVIKAELTETFYEGRDHLLEEQKLFYNAVLNKGLNPVDFQAGKKAVLAVEQVLNALKESL